MPKIVFERDIPGIGEFSPDRLYAISLRHDAAIQDVGSGLHGTFSHVTDDKLYCVYSS